MKRYLSFFIMNVLLNLTGCTHTLVKGQADSLEKNVNSTDVSLQKRLMLSIDGNNTVYHPLLLNTGNEQIWQAGIRKISMEDNRIVSFQAENFTLVSITKNPLWHKIDIADIGYNQSVKIPVIIRYKLITEKAVHALLILSAHNFEEKTVLGAKMRLLKITELVSIPSLKFNSTNIYWKETTSDSVLASSQKWLPNSPRLDYRYIQ